MEEVITTQEIRDVARGTRIAVMSMLHHPIPYSCSVTVEQYWEYIEKHKSKIINFLPINYLCMKHKHNDTYIHFAKREVLEKIIEQGYLSDENSSDECSLGKAIYTYPLKSGMFFYNNNVENGAFLVFETDEEHHHVVQTDDTPYCIGEADFFCGKLKVENPRIMTYAEVEEISKKVFDWDYAKKNYFGLSTTEGADYNSMYSIIEKYN